MKKNKLFLLPLIVGSLSLISCAPSADSKYSKFDGTPSPLTSYQMIDDVNYQVNVGGTKVIGIKSSPSFDVSKAFEFTSENPSVASVNANGVITGVSTGHTLIKVKAKVSGYETKVNAFVTENADADEISSIISTTDAAYKDVTYSLPKKCRRYETSTFAYLSNNKVQTSSQSMEVIDYDAEEGYFKVTSDDLYVKTQGGEPEKLSGTWIFYIVNNFTTRLIHITKTVKTFFDITGTPKAGETIEAILDAFFVSGRKIVSDMIDNFAGKEDFSSVKLGIAEDDAIYSKFGANSFYYLDVSNFSASPATAADELNIEPQIPAGTLTSSVQKIGFYYDNNVVKGLDIGLETSYTLDGAQRIKRVARNQVYTSEFEKETYDDPKEQGFTPVKTIYDL